jgi:hypothetical protein
LKLPETTGPTEFWLTEFEDAWPYKLAPADVYFSRAAKQDAVKRPPSIRYTSVSYPTDGATYVLVCVVVILPVWSRMRRRRQA